MGKAASNAVATETISLLQQGQLSPHRKASKPEQGRLKRSLASAYYIPNALEHLREPLPHRHDDEPTKVVLYQGGSLEAAEWAQHHIHLDSSRFNAMPAVLDFASDSNPGGGWRGNQQGTQEEAICRISSLGLSLEHLAAASPPYSIPSKGCVYVPEVAVVRQERNNHAWKEEPLWCGVIAAALRHTDDNQEFIRSKIRGVMAVATRKGHGILVGGAWGCGAFGNDAWLVAEAWRIEARKSGLPVLVLALPSKQTMKTFQSVMTDAQVVSRGDKYFSAKL